MLHLSQSHTMEHELQKHDNKKTLHLGKYTPPTNIKGS
jgi:hypothetical protein